MPQASVVVPTHNRSAVLAACVRSLLALDYPGDGFEIVVVDAASTDDTAATLAAIASEAATPAVSYVRCTSRDANRARNAGIAEARAPLIAFIDDDVLVPEGWLRALVQGASQFPEAECFGGAVRPIYAFRPPRTCAAHEVAGASLPEGSSSEPVQEAWGCNMAIRRAAFERVGPFRVGLPALQEWEWQRRLLIAGGKLVHLPEAWLWHRRDSSDLRLRRILRDMLRRGYLEGSLGQSVPVRVSVDLAWENLRHGLSARCARGLGDFARDAGRVAGALHARRTASGAG